MNNGTFGRLLYLLQDVRQPFRIARELDGGGIGEKFAPSRDSSFNDAAEKCAVPADERNEESDHQNHQVNKHLDACARLRLASNLTVTLAIGPAHQPIAQQRDAKQTLD